MWNTHLCIDSKARWNQRAPVLITKQRGWLPVHHCSLIICFPHEFGHRRPWVTISICIPRNYVTWIRTHKPNQHFHLSRVDASRGEYVLALVLYDEPNEAGCRLFWTFRFITEIINKLNGPNTIVLVCVPSPVGAREHLQIIPSASFGY